jgi:hypothetical protein
MVIIGVVGIGFLSDISALSIQLDEKASSGLCIEILSTEG